jgi:hypothetical protein
MIISVEIKDNNNNLNSMYINKIERLIALIRNIFNICKNVTIVYLFNLITWEIILKKWVVKTAGLEPRIF